jgi:hypothetical protein
MIFERITLMKKILLLLLCIVHCALCIDLRAQDDAESIVSGDIEVEGLENFWVESRLITDIDVVDGFKPARPAGGNIAFLTHVQKYMSKVFNILFEKYPEEMLGRVGMHTEVHIEFTVTKDAEIQLDSISNGAIFGIDVVVAEKLFKTYRKWTPAKVNGEAVDSHIELVIDVSI